MTKATQRRRLGLLALPGLAAALLLGALVVSPTPRSHGATAGTPLTWGNNDRAQLGDGTLQSRPDPEDVVGLSGIIQVAGGGRHSLALRQDGTVFAWGANDRGQLGDNTTIDRRQPVPVQNLQDVVAVSAGGSFSLALKSDGTVWSWGDDSFAQLGDAATPADQHAEADSVLPVPVTGLPFITQIAAGQNSALVLSRGQTVWGWGENDHGELAFDGDGQPVPVPTQAPGLAGVQQLSAGFHHGLAILADGTVAGWGLDDAGQLGNAAGLDAGCLCRSTPLPVLDEGGVPLTDITAVSGGGQHSLAIRHADAAVLAWGDNTYGQLGDGTTQSRETPKLATGLSGIIAIAAGGHHSLALGALQVSQNGQQQVLTLAYGWGLNLSGQAGSHQYDEASCTCRKLPATVTGSTFGVDPLLNVTGIAAGDIHSLAIASADATALQRELSLLVSFPNGGGSTSCLPGACPPPCGANCAPSATPTNTPPPCVAVTTPNCGPATVPPTSSPTPQPTPNIPITMVPTTAPTRPPLR